MDHYHIVGTRTNYRMAHGIDKEKMKDVRKNEETGKFPMGYRKPPTKEELAWIEYSRECKEALKAKPFLSRKDYYEIMLKLGYRKG